MALTCLRLRSYLPAVPPPGKPWLGLAPAAAAAAAVTATTTPVPAAASATTAGAVHGHSSDPHPTKPIRSSSGAAPSGGRGSRGGGADLSAAVPKTLSPANKDEPPAVVALRRGEFRVVMNLERVLVRGPECKQIVDGVVDRLFPVGAQRDDIVEYKLAAEKLRGRRGEGRGDESDRRAALVELGVKALR